MNKIIKSPLDKSEYITYQLSNGLNVFLEKDNRATLSCITMSIKIGYMYDTIPGIAHFLEHMLFNGTIKYPNENAFLSYISKHGGVSNAFTEHNSTCYFYNIQSTHLRKSLDMFGQFFISPLLNKNTVEREREALNAEHIKNKSNDDWRLHEILRYACNETHPLKNFGTGSNETLNIPDLEIHVRKFFDTYYSSNLMTLNIITNNDLEKVMAIVNEIFINIPIRANLSDIKKDFGKIFKTPATINVIPIEDKHKLSLYWELPSYHNEPYLSPINFLAHILGHEGKNTIHYTLTQNGYISHLRAGVLKYVYNKCIFHIDLELSPFGVKNKTNIIKVIFDYIDLIIKNIYDSKLRDLYNEILVLSKYSFNFDEKISPDDRGIYYHKLITIYEIPLNYLLTISYIMDNFDTDIRNNLLECLKSMNRDNVIIIFGSKYFNGSDLKTDKNYGTKYQIVNSIEINHKSFPIDLPQLNPYISVSTKIININYHKPQNINKNINDNMKVYILPTNKYHNPDINIHVKIDIPLSLLDKETNTTTLIYFNTIMADINHERYLCNTAHYLTHVEFNMGKLYITIQGNCKKICNVADFIVNSILGYKITNSNKSFERAKYVLSSSDKNIIYDPPYTRISSFFNKKICSKFYDNYDRLSIINSDKLQFESTINIIKKILKLSSVTMLLTGNVTTELSNELIDIFSKFSSNLKYDDCIDLYDTPTNQDEIIVYPTENNYDVNSAMGFHIFIKKIKYGITKNWDMYICLTNIIDKLINNNYFDTLRTKEQFGYVVFGTQYDVGDKKCISKYYRFIVQSPNKSVNDIINRTKLFILEFKKILNEMSEDQFNDIITNCIVTLNAEHNNLMELSDFYKTQLEYNFLTFDLVEKLTKTYKTINKEIICKFYDSKFINRKSIIIGFTGNK